MSEVQLPREAENQVVDIDVRHLILGCVIAGSTFALLAFGITVLKDRARLRRQEALLQAGERLLLLVRQIKRESHMNSGIELEGDRSDGDKENPH